MFNELFIAGVHDLNMEVLKRKVQTFISSTCLSLYLKMSACSVAVIGMERYAFIHILKLTQKI